MTEEDDDEEDDEKHLNFVSKLLSKGLLNQEDLDSLMTSVMLSDNIINTAQESLRREYGSKGLQNVNYGQTMTFNECYRADKLFVQVTRFHISKKEEGESK